MKYIFIFSVFVGLFLSCRSKQTVAAKAKPEHDTVVLKINSTPYSFTFYDSNYHTIVSNKKLMESWKAFVEAVQTDNYELVKNLSTDCITCESCAYNTEAEDSIHMAEMLKHRFDSLVYESAEDNRFPFDDFFKNDYKICFYDKLKSRMSDSIKVEAHYDEANMHIYSSHCISRARKKGPIKIVEFFVTTTDKSEMFPEGGVTALAFIETPTGFKFCGYSTIP